MRRAKKRILLLADFSLPYSDNEVSKNGTTRKQPLLIMSDLIEEEEIEGLLKKVPEWDHENKSITQYFRLRIGSKGTN